MPNQNNSFLKLKGLETNNSELSEVEAGSLSICNNIVLNRDSTIEPRRGFKIYGNSMGNSPTNDKAKQLFEYKNRILRHFSSTLQFDNGSGTFSSFSGTYSVADSILKIRGTEANSNFYFTSAQSIQKISAKTASDLSTASGFITKAGGIKALDGVATLNSQQGFFLQNSKVAYRIVWGIKDRASNLVLGSPSSRIIISNSQLNLMIKDFNNLLAAIDQAGLHDGSDELSDSDYVSTLKIPINTGNVTTLYDNLLALSSKLENDINLISENTYTRTSSTGEVNTNIATITFSSNIPAWVVPGQSVTITNFTAPTLTVLNGTFTVTGTTSNTISYSLTNPDIVATADTGAKVIRNQFSQITVPTVPSIPPTATQLNNLQTYYNEIVTILQSAPPSQIDDPTYFDNSNSTESATVNITFTIPEEITSAYFYQIYRTALATASGVTTLDDVEPGDEMGLVYESNPTTTELLNKEVTIHDITPETFRGANLYTNPQSGETILQANEAPPIAKDITLFKGSIFYANTKNRHKLIVSLLGLSNFTSNVSNFVILNSNGSSTYTFISPTQEVTAITTIADVAGSLAGKYFFLNSTNNTTRYYVWYKVSGVGTDPLISGKIGIQVDITTNDSDANVALKTRTKLNQYSDFNITGATNQVIVTNALSGICDDATVQTSGFSMIITPGQGEDASLNRVLLSDAGTPSQQVEETTNSLIRVINKDANSPVYGYYLSGEDDVPGQFVLENREISDPEFIITTTDSNILSNFNPTLKVSKNVTSITAGNPSIINLTSHGYSTGDQIFITDTNTVPTINGIYTVTVINANSFSIPVESSVSGTTGLVTNYTNNSDNEIIPNRIYFSKFQQPDAVPLVNYLDVGAKDSEILRIVPLRDSLFIFKDEGIWRISGDSALVGFVLTGFDTSTYLTAPNSPAVLNNQIYAYTNQGIIAVSDTGVSVVSRSIENLLIPLVQYNMFATSSFGVSYETDRSYLFWTLNSSTDTVPTICYRYNVFTQCWTTWNISKTCGLVKDDKLYLGAGDTNFIEIERKDFGRTDYADREWEKILSNNSVNGNVINLPSLDNVSIGDVFVQNQRLTIYKLNQLLKKLDNDNGVNDSDYFSTLEALPGVNLRDILTALALKLDADIGTTPTEYSDAISGFSSSFEDTQLAYNAIITLLIASPNTSFKNYSQSFGIFPFEAIITDINKITNKITLNITCPIISGTSTIYNHIPTNVTWNLQTFGDPEIFKQVSECKFIFYKNNFSTATIGFATDLSGAFEEIQFSKYGPGMFGVANFGETPFGGDGNKIPLRTLIPRNKQRCRTIVPRITHKIAREKVVLLGYSMVVRGYGQKAYR